ncbi:XrtA/PEP-CTERM system amidotransferase [Sphingoaurantiacus capsulatus]|uniref:asparagine synthase (glutamine-hydrolyzing) n=1 Tax=Sphingoaurantiacus capsulatus TaxID=1771310 RepID=A0ABV7XDM2_9SPHN
MCGIAGYFDTREQRPIDERLLRAMTDAVAHRGPDGADIWRGEGVGLGHRRLAIIDLVSGAQPMATPDGQVTIVFNGEIYNFQEIRRDLEAAGHRFRTSSDTEVILHAWLEGGEACVHRLRGMFAFAIHDARTRTLFLARDRLGVKPLHYAELPGGEVIFGSELKALLPHPKLARELDPTAIEDYFAYGYIPDPKCALAGVKKLQAGHTLTLRQGKPVPAPVRYWDVDFTTRHRGNPDDLAAELTERMREAVKLRMIADVPLGAFLSGGVDSSAVVALMAELSDTPVNTCSIGFDVAGYDETEYAAEIARRYATNHRSRIVDPNDFGLVERLAQAFDEPFADASALPTYRVCALARENVTVALSGDGADEAFAGYRRYRLHANEEKVRGLLPLGFRQSVFGPLGRAFPKMDWAPRMFRAKSTFEALGRSTEEAYFNSIAVLPDRLRQHLFSPSFRRELQGHWAGSLYVDTMKNAPADDALGQAQYADIQHWLPGDILTKMDRASMAVSLEAREPLLDHELVAWAAGLPPEMRIRGGESKWLMKKAMERYVPKKLLYRPKMGFVVPISDWFRGPLAERAEALATRSAAVETGWFDPAFLKKAVDDHRAGRAEHGRLLWQMLMLDQSLGKLIDLPVKAAA